MTERLARWALRRAYAGHLVWIDPDGVAHDLGRFSRREIGGIGWAVGVAYRATRERSERVRLAGLRDAGARLLDASRRARTEVD